MSSQRDALDGLVYARALLVLGEAAHRTAVDAAVTALTVDLDNEPLRELAGLPSATGSSELEALLDNTIAALDPAYLSMARADAITLVARHYALRYLDASLTARQLSSWAHSAVGHDVSEAVEPLAELDDALDLQDTVGSPEQVDVDAIVRDFLTATEATFDRLKLHPIDGVESGRE